MFERHAYSPKTQPVEPNPLNDAGNISSVRNFFDKVYNVKEFCHRPFERVKNREKGSVERFYIDGESITQNRVDVLNCKTAERMVEADGSVDYIITDPPYYDNVQYLELSDYFYVWLREVLKQDYDEFQPELVAKAREIVVNSRAGKSKRFFIESLTNLFSEANRVLKPDGEMIFTYHQNENEACR